MEEIDIYRSANLLVNQYGDEAPQRALYGLLETPRRVGRTPDGFPHMGESGGRSMSAVPQITPPPTVDLARILVRNAG